MALPHQRQNATRDLSSLEARSILTPTERDPLETISIKCHGYLAADLDTLCRQAAIIANRDGCGTDRLAIKDYEEAMQSIKTLALRGHWKNPSFEYTGTPKPMHVWISVLLKEYYCAYVGQWAPPSYIVAARAHPLTIGLLSSQRGDRYGPPGTGEALLAKAVATESEANLMAVSIPNLIKGEAGESEKAITMVFKMVTRCSPCIDFLDELEAIFDQAAKTCTLVWKAHLAITLELGNCGQGVVISAVTNHPEAIDTSILRPN
ncbi:AAA ATPase, CDC48 sub [Mortierella sp. NVP85]|nr:AAA ATPase, CDC48 sub [Mortierella sp. NVP85]